MPNPNQAPMQTSQEQPEQPVVGEFDHLLGQGPEQHLTVEDAAVRPIDPGAGSAARAEIERNVKAADIRMLNGIEEHTQPK